MGLSTKQVSNDHALYWGQTLQESGSVDQLPNPAQSRRQQQQQQNQQQPSEPLKCPRCSSVNTKFCYYNNYNKSQPRHFCKDCKRHWTKGGTLRNVPVGGGRKNKRLKASKAATITAAAANTATKNASHPIVPHHGQPEDLRNFPLPDDQKNISEVLCQALINNLSSIPYDAITSLSGKNLMSNKNSFSSTLSPLLSQLPQDHNLQFSFSSLSPFDTIPCSSFLSSNLSLSNPYDYTGELDQMESSSTVTTVTPPASSAFSHSWQCPTTSSSMPEIPNYWNWNDIEHFVSSDINISWDDIEMKP